MGLNIRLAFRFLWKNRLYTLINIIGLSLGLACCFIILLHIRFETSYDQIHDKKDRIVLVRYGGSYTPFLMGEVMPDFFPEIEKIVRFGGLDWSGIYVKDGKNYIREQKAIYADSTFFDIFSFPLLSGDKSRILRSPDKLLLSESMAVKHFGTTDVVGKTIILRVLNTNFTFTIEGIFKDFPEQSNFRANFLLSIKLAQKTFGNGMFNNWGGNSMQTYLLLKHPDQIPAVSERLKDFEDKYHPKDLQISNTDYALQPLTKIHLYTERPEDNFEPQGSITRVIIFASIAALVLIIAVINFILLSLSLSYQRIREFGIRKVVGAVLDDLVSLVGTEFLIVFILAVQISLMLVELSIPWFKSHLGFMVHKGVFSNIGLLSSFLAVVFLLGYFASMYITVNVSRIKPIESLRNKLPAKRSLIPARSILFILQFSIMTGLLICLFIMQKQLWLTRNKDLGYRNEELLSINVPQSQGEDLQSMSFGRYTNSSYKIFVEELKKIPGVRNASGANYVPPTPQLWLSGYKKPYSEEKLLLEDIQGDFGLVETLGLDMIAGRTFSPDIAGDSMAIIINENAAKELGFMNAGDALDSYVLTDSPQPVKFPIIGVFRDFHVRALYDNILPMAFRLNNNVIQQLAVRLNAGDNRNTITEINKLWEKIYPDDPIEMTYVDEALHLNYSKEDQAYSLIQLFTFLSLAIALMGLFGLSANTAERRIKETGIRKVNGAMPSDILAVFSKQYMLWILIAFCIALPASWYGMKQWLQHFAYKTELSWWIFVLALLISVSVAFITIAWQTWRTANMNPSEALRYE